MRDKYGIQKKNAGGRPKTEVLEEIKKDYGMNDKDAKALQQKISEVRVSSYQMPPIFNVVSFSRLNKSVELVSETCIDAYSFLRMLPREKLQRPRWTRRWRRGK